MTTTSTAIALRTHSALGALRTLDELDDDDALAVGLAFKRPSAPLLLSILGVGAAVALAAVTTGVMGACIVGALASGGAGLAAQHGARDKLRVELGVSADDAKRLFAATAHWTTLRAREPSTDDELRAYGRLIIDKARGG